MFDTSDDVLTVSQAMELLGVGKNTIYALLNRGELKGFRIGTRTWRIPKHQLTRYIMSKYR